MSDVARARTRTARPTGSAGTTAPRLPRAAAAADAAAGTGFSLPPDLLASLLADGDEELVVWALRSSISEQGRARAYDDFLTAAMALVGENWYEGRWGIAEEHLASQTLLRALDAVRPDPTTELRSAPLAVLAGVPGEHHMIGLVCLGHVLEEGGWSVANLGADIPGGDVARFASRQGGRLVAITASLEDRLPAVRETIAAIRGSTAAADAAIVLGGRLAATPGRAQDLGIDWAGASLAEAEPVLARLRERAAATR